MISQKAKLQRCARLHGDDTRVQLSNTYCSAQRGQHGVWYMSEHTSLQETHSSTCQGFQAALPFSTAFVPGNLQQLGSRLKCCREGQGCNLA